MDFALLLVKGLGVAIGVGLGVFVLAAVVLRKQRENLRMGAGAIGVGAAFVAGYLVFWGWPGVWPVEGWQMAFWDAVAAGVLVGAAMFLRGVGRLVLLVAAVGVVTGLTVREKLAPREVFLPGLAGVMVVYLISFRAVVRDARVWLVGPAVMFVSGVGAVLAVMLYVDQNTGRMLILICALTGMMGVAGFIRPLRDVVRGGVGVLGMMYAAVVGLAAFYNYALPNSVFVLLALGPVAVVVGWMPALRKRPWVCVLVAVVLALAAVVPGVVIAVKNAPAFE